MTVKEMGVVLWYDATQSIESQPMFGRNKSFHIQGLFGQEDGGDLFL
jgi:hypothetical protein